MLNTHLKKVIYYAYVHSHLQYCLGIWGSMISKQRLNKLKVVQNEAVRLCTNAKIRSSLKPIYQKLCIISLEKLIDIELSKISFKYVNDLESKSILGLFEQSTHDYGTRNKNSPKPKLHKSAQYSKSFLAKAPSIWLSLPDDVKSSTSLKMFKTRIKKYMLKH